jgi:hypothetical protein
VAIFLSGDRDLVASTKPNDIAVIVYKNPEVLFKLLKKIQGEGIYFKVIRSSEAICLPAVYQLFYSSKRLVPGSYPPIIFSQKVVFCCKVNNRFSLQNPL